VVAVVVSLVVVPGGARPSAVDTWVIEATADWTSGVPAAVDAAALVGAATDVLTSTLLAIAVVLGLMARRRWRLALFVAVSALVGVLVVEVLKRTVGRMRPPGAEDYFAPSGLDRSFPSGHAAVGVYIYCACAVLLVLAGRRAGQAALEWCGTLLFMFGVTLGLTRIILGVHWATDVLTGWAIGSAVLLASTALLRPDDLVLRRVPHEEPAE